MSHESDVGDLRVRRTHKLLREALLALMAERGFEALTIQAITDRAMVNRTTFYRHYRDKSDLLARCMDDVFAELEASLAPPPTDAGRLDWPALTGNLTRLFEHAAAYAPAYQLLLSERGGGQFAARARGTLEEVSRRRWEMMRPALADPRLPPAMTLSFIAAAVLGVLQWWLEAGRPFDPATAAAHLMTLIVGGPYRALGMPGG